VSGGRPRGGLPELLSRSAAGTAGERSEGLDRDGVADPLSRQGWEGGAAVPQGPERSGAPDSPARASGRRPTFPAVLSPIRLRARRDSAIGSDRTPRGNALMIWFSVITSAAGAAKYFTPEGRDYHVEDERTYAFFGGQAAEKLGLSDFDLG